MFKRWLKALCKVLAALIVAVLLFLVFERVRGQISLAQYKRKLIAQGEKLDARDFQSSVSDAENGAPAVLDAIKRLSNGVVLPDNYPPRMKLTQAGRAIVGFREPEWVEDKKTNRWEQLAADLKSNEAVLTGIRAALGKPVLNNKVDLSEGMKMKFQHLAPAKSLTHWIGSGSQLALHEGRTHDALNDLLPLVRLPRLLAEDRLVISELVRFAIAGVAKADTWEALQADGWTEEDLAALQEAWESQDFAAALGRSLEGERIFDDACFDVTRESNEDAASALFGLEDFFSVGESEHPAWQKLVELLPYGGGIANFLKKEIYCRIWRFAWSHQDQRHGLEEMQRLIEVARKAAKGRSYAAVEAAIGGFVNEVQDRNLYDRLRYPDPQSPLTLSRTVNKAMRAETDRSLTICAIALKRYSLRHGQPPASLDALVPEFVAAVPVDYMDGQPLRYRLNPDGSFTLYSVGENLKDDGGDASLPPPDEASGGRRVRRDNVWPLPALPEEVEAYRKEARKN